MPKAFTLIELLVVVTIIVVLLALLTPAVDRAIYQADLAVCGANQRGFCSAVSAYAAANRRFYPERGSVKQGFCVVDLKRGPVTDPNQPFIDDRPVILQFAPLKMLVDPLVKSVDLSTAKSNFVRSSWYGLYFGAGFRGNPMMRKLGDRFRFTTGTAAGAVDAEFDLIIADADVSAFDIDTDLVGHPDADGRLANLVAENQSPAQGIDSGLDPTSLAVSYWAEQSVGQRGPVDLNFTHADGSVERVLKVKPVTYPPTDERMVITPFFYAGANHGQWPVRVVQLPRPR
jgi:prepilin-type N-terminal cleavage/methylation domain-containing protein